MSTKSAAPVSLEVMIASEVEARTLDGDGAERARSIEALARVHSGRLLRLARGILGDPGEAEDAVQDALLLAWKSWDDLRSEDRRSAWLTRICVRRCLRVRTGLVRRRAHGTDVDIAPLAAPADSRWGEWDAAFARLSPRQRAVVVLHYRLQFTLDECAALMGSRPGSTRRHLVRALAHLRKEIEHD